MKVGGGVVISDLPRRPRTLFKVGHVSCSLLATKDRPAARRSSRDTHARAPAHTHTHTHTHHLAESEVK